MIKKWFLAFFVVLFAKTVLIFPAPETFGLDVSQIKKGPELKPSKKTLVRKRLKKQTSKDVCSVNVLVPGKEALCEHQNSFKLDARLTGELDQYIQAQWKEHERMWIPGSSQLPLKKSQQKKDAQAIFFYSHGYPGNRKITVSDAGLAFCPLESAFRNFIYRVCNPGLDYSKKFMSFAQGYDVYQVDQHLVRLINQRNKHCPNVHIICIAHSNGASTLISALCKNPYLAQHVEGVILLAPYADITEVSRVKRVSRWGGDRVARRMLKFMAAPNYDNAAPSPVQLVEQGNYPEKIPTLLVHSPLDSLVTYNNFEMFEKAFQIKNRNVAFLSLKDSSKEDAHYFRRPSKELRAGLENFVDTVLVQPTTSRVVSADDSESLFKIVDAAFSGPG